MSDFTDRLRDGAHAIADKASDLAERIRERAHAIWEREGHPHGKDQEHFYRAQQELAEEDAAAAATKPVEANAPAKPRATKPKVTEGEKAAADTSATKSVAAPKPRGKEAAKGDEPKAAAAPRRRTGTKKTTE